MGAPGARLSSGQTLARWVGQAPAVGCLKSRPKRQRGLNRRYEYGHGSRGARAETWEDGRDQPGQQ